MVLDKLLPIVPVERLRGRLATAQADVQKAKNAFADAAYAAEETPGSQADRRRETASRALVEAERWLQAVQAALERAAAKEEQQRQDQAAAALRARWAIVESAAADRIKAAHRIANATNDLAGAYGALCEASERMIAPGVIKDPYDALLIKNDIEQWFRASLVRAGFRFALKWPWESEALPDIVTKFEEANRLALAEKVAP